MRPTGTVPLKSTTPGLFNTFVGGGVVNIRPSRRILKALINRPRIFMTHTSLIAKCAASIGISESSIIHGH